MKSFIRQDRKIKVKSCKCVMSQYNNKIEIMLDTFRMPIIPKLVWKCHIRGHGQQYRSSRSEYEALQSLLHQEINVIIPTRLIRPPITG